VEIYDPLDQNNIIKIDELRWPRIEANGDWLFTQFAQPKRYTIHGSQFDLYPIPDAVYHMRLYYDARKNDMATDTDTPDCPIDFQDLVVFYACMLAKKQNETDDDGFAALFNMRKVELVQSLIRRGGEDSHCVEAYLEGII
jgi:hypothetical protein